MLVLASLALGCASEDEPDPEPELTPIETLEACGLPNECPNRISMSFCGGLEGVTYQPHDICYFEALLGEPPNVIRASTDGPSCGDVTNGNDVDIYRWADGSMTCALGGPTVRACTLPDTSIIQNCLADAQAGAQVTETCLSFTQWGLEFGDEIEAECR